MSDALRHRLERGAERIVERHGAKAGAVKRGIFLAGQKPGFLKSAKCDGGGRQASGPRLFRPSVQCPVGRGIGNVPVRAPDPGRGGEQQEKRWFQALGGLRQRCRDGELCGQHDMRWSVRLAHGMHDAAQGTVKGRSEGGGSAGRGQVEGQLLAMRACVGPLIVRVSGTPRAATDQQQMPRAAVDEETGTGAPEPAKARDDIKAIGRQRRRFGGGRNPREARDADCSIGDTQLVLEAGPAQRAFHRPQTGDVFIGQLEAGGDGIRALQR